MFSEEKKKAIIDEKYPLAAKYDAEWQLENEMGSPCLWLVESVANKMNLKPGMRVLDMGCGNAISSIFLAKEFGVQVFATDLWVAASDNWKRICEAGVEHLVYPIHAEAHDLPFADGFFDAIVCINSYQFYGTADTYFNEYFGKLIKKDGQIGFALPGIYKEFDEMVPDYLKEHWWTDFYYFHSFDWWKRHFKRCGTVDIEFVDDFDGEGNSIMMKWEPIPDRMKLVRIDNGRNLSWIRMVLRKR
ncbi:SAM-dependent methyltransferase [Oceanirhabdus sp. W0125-5]|uniref:SAM-dependent methyltransferase n=1 Tax=Oceanirhabdus sp. W0125-5 TaxID=2999116 RepID=UPI0022F2C3FD|nr:methyltransferase domain-containing protein [Oceanirhabdus sp. W0125-5]WBW95598.1 methyltransferase domain-containing protein [Oceanirhabdus sp. W0125-5]